MRQKVCLIYSWENFKLSFLEKDVGLFPYFFAKSSGLKLECIIFDSLGINQTISNGDLYNSKNYLQFIKDCILNNISKLMEVKYFILFHMSLRTSLLSFLLKIINPSAKIIVKTDLSISNVNDLSNIRKRNFIKYYLMSFLNRTVDAFCIETTQSIELLLSKHNHLIEKNKVYHVPNGITQDDFLLKECIEKDINSICIITRDDSPLKGVDRIASLLVLLDQALAKCNSTATIRIVGPLSSITCKNIINLVGEVSTLDVHFLGSLSKSETLKILLKSHLFVNLSIEESYCFALIEAALANCHIITTPVGVANDLSKNYQRIDILKYNENHFVSNILNGFNRPCPSEDFLCLFNDRIYDWERIVDDFYNKFSRSVK
ncbi:glycosyltransferase family 4 protein [Aeromonas jandaei]|uniref:glycosyltransferase n=1 Tax=Aeromonas jandaei TaxID=650 RepID=UPI001C5A8C54|nr:glycosyltransferase [Aeromonas jandaei]MBW3761223.1 glycosyltransferase family 4 protein [Aeromonas jandaei]